ncbi:MAG: FtsW/RodA/SpoVE family cell cycle protein [Phycisphaerales bacterium]|nr:FtsW/RodA/SpoVE family cell cycle protein [Phycisphaerales bacterium]
MRSGDVLLILVVAMLGTGVVAVQSAGLRVTDALPLDAAMSDRIIWLGIAAVLAFLAGGRLSPGFLQKRWVVWTALAVATVLSALVLIPGIGREVNGARRWIDVGPVGFQPSELAKWATVIFLAAACTWWARDLFRFRRLLLVLIPVGVMAVAVLKEDLGTSVLMLAVAAGMVAAAGAKIWHLAVMGTVAAPAIVGAIAIEPYRVQRLQAFLDPWADPTGTGYHVIQSMAAIAGPGPGGRGLGNGIQKYGYLPEDTTDFIFAVICEETGVGGAVLVVALCIGLLLVGFTVLRSASSVHARLLCLGVLLTIGGQALMNLLVVTGLAPTKGIALPLISSGGTGWLVTAFALGWIRAIDRQHAQATTPSLEASQLPA